MAEAIDEILPVLAITDTKTTTTTKKRKDLTILISKFSNVKLVNMVIIKG